MYKFKTMGAKDTFMRIQNLFLYSYVSALFESYYVIADQENVDSLFAKSRIYLVGKAVFFSRYFTAFYS